MNVKPDSTAHPKGVMAWVDIPPGWLLVFIALGWLASKALGGFGSGAGWVWVAGLCLIGAGVGLMVLAVVEFLRARTSFIPRRNPSAFLTGGVYRFSRNPIYLGDALVLAGFVLVFGAPLALVLVPVFCWWIARRFIDGEEARLRLAFGQDYEDWSRRVRRWI